jgi:Domain of unknown function (DUF4375)
VILVEFKRVLIMFELFKSRRPNLEVATVIIVLALAVWIKTTMTGGHRATMRPSHREGEILEQLRNTSSSETRDQLIAELERTPVYNRSFYSRWIFIHEAWSCFDCWSDNGYDTTISPVPRDIQILCATDYGKEDIDNGGFHQFFHNGTGTFAPEMVEWFDRSGLDETAAVLREAIAVFGDEFPRSQDVR